MAAGRLRAGCRRAAHAAGAGAGGGGFRFKFGCAHNNEGRN